MNRYFAIIGIALAVAIVLVIRTEQGKEWALYQKAFLQKERNQAAEEFKQAEGEEARNKAEAKLKNLLAEVPEMKQVYIGELDRADRCITCHLGIAEGTDADVEKPFNAHPGTLLKKHPVEKYGCTVCHGGQGPAVTNRAAHGTTEDWTQPILSKRYSYGYCGRCHKEPDFRAAPQLTGGKRLFRELGCFACHQVKGYEDFEKTGPALSRLGTKVNAEWLTDYMLSPKKYWKRTTMPDYKFGKEEAESISAYLMTLKGEQRAREDDGGLEGYKPSLQRGRELFGDGGCLTCHEVKGLYYEGAIDVGKMGPELTRIASKVDRNWLVSYLRDPREYLPETRMPSFRFTPQEASDLAEYLLSFGGGGVNRVGGSHAPDPALIEQGRKLVKDNNCAGCHETEGIEAGKTGPELTNIGDKPTNRLDYGENPPGAERSLPNWLYAKVMTPHTFRPDTARMPYPNINNPQADAIVTYLLTLTEDSLPEKYMVRELAQPRRVYPLGGMVKQLFDEFKCLSCHPLGTEGEAVGPQLDFEGNRVSREWLEDYLKTPTLIRPSLAAGMPKFRFTDEERERLAEHSSHILLDDRIRRGEKDIAARYGGDYSEGKKLFSRKLACIACHSIESKGGRVGPDLTRARERLKPEWVFLWLKSPQSFLSQTRMPDFGLTDGEIASLMSYLLAERPQEHEPPARDMLGKPEAVEEEDLLVSIEVPRRRFLRGEALFMRYCFLCHGEEGNGRGFNAQFLPREPRDFTDADYMSKKSDEDLYQVISGGGASAGLSFLMPPWGRTLDKGEIQDLISYLRRFPDSY